MKIKSLRINLYKSFKQPTIINLSANFNAFIGPNNSGKTNILDAIEFLFNPEMNPERLQYRKTDIQLTVDLGPEEKNLCKTSRIQLKGDKYTVSCEDKESRKVPVKTIGLLASQIKRLHYEDFSNISEIERLYSSLAQNYPAVFSRLTKLLEEYFPEIQSIERIANANANSPATVDEGEHRSITIERLGSGFRRVLVILLYALHPEYSVILIDEPEIHLHPGMIKKVRKVLQAANANQVLIASHSTQFIRASNLHQVFRILKDEHGSHAYYLNQSKQRIDRKRLVQELNSDNVEMFFADKVLLVEGVSDRILMRGLINRFYTGQQDVKVIYTHGKSNIDTYIRLMEIFHIPYIVLLDRDALNMVARQFNVPYSRNRHRKKRRANRGVIEALKRKHIYVFDNGTIENNYPRKYQKKDTKPLNALYAAANITPEEYRSAQMRNIREIIEQL